jgi:hypothetical protein
MKLETLVSKLQTIYPEIHLKPSANFYWSPIDDTVYYNSLNETQEGLWAILHESGHAILRHTKYYSDIELVKMEVAAWESAKELGDRIGIKIDDDHAQDCVDSYRNWLHRRSLCPDCDLAGIQIETKTYTCVFCHKKWHVTPERFCRPYRRAVKSER